MSRDGILKSFQTHHHVEDFLAEVQKEDGDRAGNGFVLKRGNTLFLKHIRIFCYDNGCKNKKICNRPVSRIFPAYDYHNLRYGNGYKSHNLPVIIIPK